MGTDIHAFMEVKINGEWVCHSILRIDRNYQLFAKMGNDRVDNKPITDMKGLPDDISQITKMYHEYWVEDGHTHSWFDLDEIGLLQEWYDQDYLDRKKAHPNAAYDYFEKQFSYFMGNGWHKDRFDGSCVQDARLVFWFDS